MAAPFFSTPFQPYVYQSPQEAVIPFQILGGEAQIVQIMLKPQDKVIAKPGSMCYMSGSIQMENVYLPENEVGMWQWLFGKSVTSIFLLNSGSSDGFVGIAAPSLARILPIDLAMFGGEILCQPDAFLCSINDVKVNNTVDQRARNVVAGAEGFLRQKLSGQGLAFIVAGGSVVQKNLEVGEVLAVDVSCIVALTATVNVQVKYNSPMRRVVFGGDNLVTAVLTGPGIVFIQSLPFHRLSQRIARCVTFSFYGKSLSCHQCEADGRRQTTDGCYGKQQLHGKANSFFFSSLSGKRQQLVILESTQTCHRH